MWTERPNALKDGLLVATAAGLLLSAIVIIKSASDANPSHVPKCQEAVADVEKRGDILAQCPAGTYVEIDDGNVICRCGRRPVITREPLQFIDPMPTEPPTEPILPFDGKGITL